MQKELVTINPIRFFRSLLEGVKDGHVVHPVQKAGELAVQSKQCSSPILGKNSHSCSVGTVDSKKGCISVTHEVRSRFQG